jgi:hypothetical protein
LQLSLIVKEISRTGWQGGVIRPNDCALTKQLTGTKNRIMITVINKSRN